MAVWSTKRRFIYGGGTLLFLAVVFLWIFWGLFYRAPSCTDNRKNGDETGVDCGGGCLNLCTSDALTPITLWSKIFNISGDVYTAAAYVENPNVNSKNPKATYRFKIYDTAGKLITTKEGFTSIPKGKKFTVFETGIILKDSKPKTADFEFLTFSPWEKTTGSDTELIVKYSTLLATTSVPRIEGTITNNTFTSVPKIELAVLVIDSKENVVAATRTYVDKLTEHTSQDFVFTWPKPFNLGVEACVNPLDVVLALDRSGSMKSESANPPEPFTTVKSTAEQFVSTLKDDDRASVFSFGNNAIKESALFTNKQFAVTAIQNLFLSTTTLENTNISEAISGAEEELTGDNSREKSKKVIVLLTDGVPTEPKLAGQPNYAIYSAQDAAKNAKDAGTIIYTIGLGKDVNTDFLKSISFDDAHFFWSPTKETLGNIYKNISSSLCTKKPTLINVIYREI
jgi:uncharacterized protein YegL